VPADKVAALVPTQTLLAQLTDPHVHVGPGDRDPAAALATAVRAVMALDARPHAVIVTGDLADNARAREYERVRELLAPLPVPVYVLGGNHDDRDAVREYFALDGSTGRAGQPFRFSATVGGLRLVACDSTIPGRDEGQFDLEQRVWLEAQLAADRTTPTLVAMHHAPLLTGIHALDELGIPRAERDALADVLAVNPQVRRVVAGHVHRGAFDVLGGCGVVACPSTYLQAPLEIPGDELHLVAEPAAFALHALLGDELVSHIQPIEE
jgi:3',5'-cyclic AMP phosphodiesterase CpdA